MLNYHSPWILITSTLFCKIIEYMYKLDAKYIFDPWKKLSLTHDEKYTTMLILIVYDMITWSLFLSLRVSLATSCSARCRYWAVFLFTASLRLPSLSPAKICFIMSIIAAYTKTFYLFRLEPFLYELFLSIPQWLYFLWQGWATAWKTTAKATISILHVLHKVLQSDSISSSR